MPAMLAQGGTQRCDGCALGFQVTGFGCMSCGSGSGALNEGVAEGDCGGRDLVAAGIISSNRNFDGRLNASVRGTFLASPPLTIAYAIAGSILHDLTREKLGEDAEGQPVFLADIWPSDAEIREPSGSRVHRRSISARPIARRRISGSGWRDIPYSDGYRCMPGIPRACSFAGRHFWMSKSAGSMPSILGARILLMLGDDVTTDHISPWAAPFPPIPKYGGLSGGAWSAAPQVRHIHRPARQP